MDKPLDICSLEYLVGTLATAYRGVITSLVMKDFCMTILNDLTHVHGIILAMPPGDYQVSLMLQGKELSRSPLRDGYFELSAQTQIVTRAKNLQIDIIQTGRHIGTFLLIKEGGPGGSFSSALELSRDVQGIDFKSLTAPLEQMPGLFKRAEYLVSAIFSAKKDWKKFSEEINGFSSDLFWYQREIYLRWYRVLVRYSRMAAERVSPGERDRAVANLLSLIELPLEKEDNRKALRSCVQVWLEEISGSTVHFSARIGQTGRALAAVLDMFPDAAPGPALAGLVSSLRETMEQGPVLPATTISALDRLIPAGDLTLLSEQSEEKRQQIIQELAGAEKALRRRNYRGVIDVLVRYGTGVLDTRQRTALLFDIIERNISLRTAEILLPLFVDLYSRVFSEDSGISKDLSRSVSRIVKMFITLGRPETVEKLFRLVDHNPEAVQADLLLNSAIAAAIEGTGDRTIVNQYTVRVCRILVPAPVHTGFSQDTWAELVNPAHLERISQFLAVLEHAREGFTNILIHLICNLFVSGVFIPDDRLFQRNISSYLNTSVRKGDFLLHYLLLKRFPVYFNEVGATGRIREDTTQIDSWGNDPVLYFVRKQVHANASNYNMRLIEAVIRCWVFDDVSLLAGSVPEDVVQNLDRSLVARYSSVIQSLFRSLHILDSEGLHLDRLLAISEQDVRTILQNVTDSDELRDKVALLCRIYRDIVHKYSFHLDHDTSSEMIQSITRDVAEIRGQQTKICDDEKTLPRESLYFKRHIAFGIPSVLGSYHEPKFDALGELFRREARIRALFETIIAEIENRPGILSLHNFGTFISYLEQVNGLLVTYGLHNFQVDELLVIFRTGTLCASHCVDLLRMWQRELTWNVDYFHRTFHGVLLDVLKRFPKAEMPEFLRNLGPQDGSFIHKAADIVMRDIVNSVVGFTELDRMLTALVSALKHLMISSGDQIMITRPIMVKKPAYFALPELSNEQAMEMAPAIGGKAKNLVYVRNSGLLVPAAVVLSAEHTPNYQDYVSTPRFDSILQEAVRYIEHHAGARFGDRTKSLFLSIRSGSYISMPGILSSVLYCGINRETLAALQRTSGSDRLGWDSYRRFIEDYSTVVHRLPSDIFERIMNAVMRGRHVAAVQELDSAGMEEVVHRYQEELDRIRRPVPEDVWVQLKESIKAVYASWSEQRAIQFRKATGVSPEWGTSVMIMQMISGNAPGSGASVFFTRKVPSFEHGISGETRSSATGEDLVSGKFKNQPLSKSQHVPTLTSLEETAPDLYLKHELIANELEQAIGGLPQEVEATYTRDESGQISIFVLQTKRMEFHRGFTRRFQDICNMELNVIGRGVGVFGGALSGIATFSSSPEEIRHIRTENKMPVILFRQSANTDDVALMPEIGGIVTATGGATSHAAILAQKFMIAAVVGCSPMSIIKAPDGAWVAEFGPVSIAEGSLVSIDGSTGLVYHGICAFTEGITD